MLVMGVDPGSRVTGYGLVVLEGNQPRCLDFGAIRVPAEARRAGLAESLKVIFQELTALIRRYSPEVIAVESVFYASNVKSALTLGHVRGVVLLAVASEGKRLTEFSPLEVKRAVVGYGRAEKGQVQTMVKTLLNLSSLPEPHDAADALALALCQAFSGNAGRRKQRRWRSLEVADRI